MCVCVAPFSPNGTKQRNLFKFMEPPVFVNIHTHRTVPSFYMSQQNGDNDDIVDITGTQCAG